MMNGPVLNGRVWTAATVLAAALMLFATACGGGEEDDPPQCTFGVADGGDCVNADECVFRADCLPGYSCKQGTCEAEQECTSDDECDAGVCGDAGVCVNPDTCESNTDCVSKTYCAEEGTCAPDPCSDITCVRGACVPGSGECTSKDTCTTSNELFDCVQGERCLGQSCLGEDAFCDQLSCDRGVCSFVDGGCVPAADCGGDDALCLDGQFCNADNQCQENLCETQGVTCDDGGVCVPAVGECENAESCSSNADCLTDHLCVGGTCTLESMACGDGDGDGGCVGNQTCVYDDGSQTATCEAPDVCETSLDCLDGTQCGGQTCVPAVACEDDAFEPNNSEGEASVLTDVTSNQLVAAELCASDADYYAFDTGDLEPFSVRGILSIQLQYADRDVGLGELEVDLLAEQDDGSYQSVAMGESGTLGAAGEVTLEHPLGPTSQGSYLVRVEGTGAVAEAGINYTLSAEIVDDLAQSACEDAKSISNGDIVTSDMRQATSSQLMSTCATSESQSERAEQIFVFEMDEPGRVDVTITPEIETENAVVSIRGSCTVGGSEVACSDQSSEGIESISGRLLDPDTYYILVSPAPEASLTRYDVALSISGTSCSASSAFCEGGTTSQYCAAGTGLETVDCTNGCNPTTGRCFRVDGDTCLTTSEITSTTSETITWGELQNDYDATGAGCVPTAGDSTQSDGKDKAFQVTIPDGKALTADLDLGESDEGSLYVVESCGDVAGTCLEGVNEETGVESLVYPNRSGGALTVFVIADSSADQILTETQIDIDFVDLVCDPEGATATQCDPNSTTQVLECGEFGLEYTQGEDCAPFQCQSGACNRPDTCSNPRDVTADAAQPGGTSITATFEDFANDLGGSFCNVSDSQTSGEDAIFEVTLAPDEGVLASLEGLNAGNWVSLYIMPQCAALDDTCLAGAAPFSAQASANYINDTGSDQTVYVVADNEDFSDSDFTLSIELVETCDPATDAPACASGDVEYCTPEGFLKAWDCSSGSCTNGQCDTPRSADFCFEAENLTSVATQQGGGSVTVDYASFTNQSGEVCSVGSFVTAGTDAYYAVDLLSGEKLDATVDAGSTSVIPALTVTNDCLEPGNACLASGSSSPTTSVTYLAQSDETVYLIVDNSTPGTSESHTLNVEVGQPCSPQQEASCSANGDGLQYCDSQGNTQEVTCTACCSTAVRASNAPGTSIPDSSATGITDTVTVSGCAGTVNEIIVGLDITHTFIGDLEVSLENPNGDSVVIHDRAGGSSSNVEGFYPVTLTPDNALSGLTGSAGDGDWTLSVSDNAGGDTGTLNQWGVSLACQ